MKTSTKHSIFLLFLLNLLSHHQISDADTINTTQVIRDGDTVVSLGQIFELGFFSPGNSTNRYVGIWYRNVTVRTVVWVANRESPLTNGTSGVLRVIQPGGLVILDENNTTIWTSNTSVDARNPVAQLLDTGNLVLRDTNDDIIFWQSFAHPTDTLLQGMYLGWDLARGVEHYLSSWRTIDDPTPGEYTLHLAISGYPQVVIRRGNSVLYRHGPWNGMRFSGAPSLRRSPIYSARLIRNSNMVYYREDVLDRSVISRFSLNQSGEEQLSTWLGRDWFVYFNLPADMCDNYRSCGAYGSCNPQDFPVCSCLDRFVPSDEDSWGRQDWLGGCVRRTNLSCQGDVFLRYTGIKLPDSENTWFNEIMNLQECREVCLRDCNCTAYSNLDIRDGGNGCLLWYGDLVDIRQLIGEEQEIYIRMASSELDSEGNRRKAVLITVSTLSTGTLLLVLVLMLLIWKRRKENKAMSKGRIEQNHDKDIELPTFDLLLISKATNNFSLSNKLGEGGFGPVYKGELEDGKEIAVKCLSRNSEQGVDEFKNEVIFIAKLQHRNLVKTLGCCIQGEEKMLIYEYMANKSLDQILFDHSNTKLLDWPTRFHIINGIARGLLYLHQDSRLRIIHRDLKASNILLDSDMNPKISDFGMAKSFGGNETEAKTRRVVGTYGYMSPEYAVDGLFSVKSDVFSFGVLVLEIVSGLGNRGFRHNDHHHNLLGHAWMLYKEGRSFEIVDTRLRFSDMISFSLTEVLRSIHVALLCVQRLPGDRPIMSSVVLMLGSEGVLPQAKQPGFFTERDVLVAENKNVSNSSNEFTITTVDGR